MIGDLNELVKMFSNFDQMERALARDLQNAPPDTEAQASAAIWVEHMRESLFTLNRVFGTPTNTAADNEQLMRTLHAKVQDILDAIQRTHGILCKASAGGPLAFHRGNLERILSADVTSALTTQHEGSIDRNHSVLQDNLNYLLTFVSDLEHFSWLVGQRVNVEKTLFSTCQEIRRRMQSPSVMPATTLSRILRRMAVDYR